MEPRHQSISPAHKHSFVEDLHNTVMLNVGGTRFEVMRATLQRFPESKLGNLDSLGHHFREDRGEYYFDRSPFLFDVVLNFYRFGELHIPTNLCSESVRKELDYWEICEKLMEDCCWVPYNSQIVKNSSLKKFKQYVVVGGSRMDLAKKGKCQSCRWYRVQPKMWAFLDDHNSSRGAKVFALISVLLVLLTTFTFVAETLPEFRHNMTETQYAEMHRPSVNPSQMSPSNDTALPLEAAAIRGGIPQLPPQNSTSGGGSKSKRSVQMLEDILDILLPYNLNVSIPDLAAQFEALFAENCSEIAQQPTHSTVWRPSDGVKNSTSSPDHETITATPQTGHLYSEEDLAIFSAPNPIFETIDMIAYAFFTLELLLRIVFCPDKCGFFKNALNIIDILALLPYYVELVVHMLYMRERYQESFIDALYVLRIVRIFRIFRMVRHYRGLKVLAYTLKASAREIMLMVIFMSLGMLIFSSLIYYTKCPEDTFTSIPHAFWWAVVTMTTVGYGDMVPKSGTGYLIGSFCALSGVLVISFTVPVIVNNFMLFYQHVEYNRRKSDVAEAKAQWRENCRRSLRFRTQNGHGRLSVPTICVEDLSFVTRAKKYSSKPPPKAPSQFKRLALECMHNSEPIIGSRELFNHSASASSRSNRPTRNGRSDSVMSVTSM